VQLKARKLLTARIPIGLFTIGPLRGNVVSKLIRFEADRSTLVNTDNADKERSDFGVNRFPMKIPNIGQLKLLRVERCTL